MQRLLFFLLISLASNLVWAQSYTCQDLPELQRVVQNLRATCGGSTPPSGTGFCRAKGYVGNSVEEAIDKCAAVGTPHSRNDCGLDLTCQGRIQGFCRAKGYIGKSFEEAIDKCAAVGTPYSRSECGLDLDCQGRVPGFCRAKGYLGKTVEETIDKCAAMGTPYSRSECSADLTCQ